MNTPETINAKARAREREAIATLIRLSARLARAHERGERTEALDAHQDLLRDIASQVERHLAKAPLERSGANVVTLMDGRIAGAIEQVAQLLRPGGPPAESVVSAVAVLLSGLGVPQDDATIRATMQIGSGGPDPETALALWVKRNMGPVAAATALITEFTRRRKTAELYRGRSRALGTSLAEATRGEPLNQLETILHVLNVLGVPPDAFFAVRSALDGSFGEVPSPGGYAFESFTDGDA